MTLYPDIRLKPLSGFDFEVIEDCRVADFDVIIKAGSVTNLTSAPRFLWWLIPPHGETKSPSIVHDFLIRNGYNMAFADCVFLYLLRISVPSWQAHIMYFSITVFKFFRKKIEVR